MSNDISCIAIVSGKGGVGKTMLSANFAWLCSKLGRTALIDLDFQNQGATGLFAPHFKLGNSNSFEAITLEELPFLTYVPIAPDLFFLPALAWHSPPSHREIASISNSYDFSKKLASFVNSLVTKEGFQFVIFDCHGGVDNVSLAAFRCANETLMVTEADTVTFAGTLELLRFY